MVLEFADVGRGVRLCYETFGSRDAPNGVALLVMGLGGTLIAWPEGFCQLLVSKGYFVIRYDNRDIGQSTKFDEHGKPSVIWNFIKKSFGGTPSSGYSLKDMADDAIGLIDVLQIEKVHVAGVSMGGMITQLLAIHYPERVLSMCSIMSTTGASGLPGTSWTVKRTMMSQPTLTEDGVVDYTLRILKAMGSPAYYDPERIENGARLQWRHSNYREGTPRQLNAIIAAEDRTNALRTISMPAVVVHGAVDQMLPLPHGQATATAIPNCELVVIDDLGHDIPPPLWEKMIEPFDRNARRAMELAAAAAATSAPPSGTSELESTAIATTSTTTAVVETHSLPEELHE